MTDIPDFNPKNLKTIGTPKASDVDPPGRIGLDRDPRLERRAQKRRMIRMSREAAAAEQIGRLPEPGEDIYLIMTGRFHGFDILTAMLDMVGEGVWCESLWIATLGFNRSQTDTLAELIDAGRIERLTFLVSHMFTEKNVGEFQYLEQALTDRGQQIANSRNHAKLMLLQLSDNRFIVAHGSLNLRKCNSFEQLVITQDENVFEFFRDFIEDASNGAIAA